jgi:hypothetical protein
MLERRPLPTLRSKHYSKKLKFLHSTGAFALPVTYLILFVSIIAVVSLTYSFAIVKISARGALLRASVAKQNMQVLDDAVHSVAWSFGASKVVYMDDCGGVFRTAVAAKRLLLNLTNEQTINSVVFNSSVGKVFYEMEPSENNDYGLYIRGDERSVINKTQFTMTQLYVMLGDGKQNMVLCYRPMATVATIGTVDGKPLNLIRVNILNLNSSHTLTLSEKFYLRVTSVNVTTLTRQYYFNTTISSLALKATLDETSSMVMMPISSNMEGAVVNLEIVICNVKVQTTEA